jgi:hypothetical protein
MALVGHADANRHALLNTRKLPVYSTCRFCQQNQTLNLLVVVQGNAQWVVQQMRVGWRAGFQCFKTGTFGYGSKPQQKIIGPSKLTGVGREDNSLTP